MSAQTAALFEKRTEAFDVFAFCDAWLASWTGNQPEKLLSFYAEDAYYSDPAKREGLRGHEQIAPYFKKLLAFNPAWTWRALEIIPNSSGFTLKWEATIPAQGQDITETGLDIVEIKEGKITRNEVYFDRSALLKSR